MKIAVIFTVFSVVATECARSDVGNTREEIEARYGQDGGGMHGGRSPYSADNPMEFRHKHRVILVWLQDGHSIAEMFLCPHGLHEEQIGRLLGQQAGSSSWAKVPCKEAHAQLWERKDKHAVSWVTGVDSDCAAFATVERDHIRDLAREHCFQAVAARAPILWADVLKLADSTRPTR